MTIQEQVWNYLKGRNLTEKSVAAVMGNIQAESGFDPTQVEQGNSIGFGLCQWSYGRRTQLEAYGTDLTHQLNFLWSELTGQDLNITGADFQWINKSGYLSLTDFMNGNGSIDDLTKAFCFCWERPNANLAHLDYRIQSANNYFNQFTGTGSGTGGDNGGGTNPPTGTTYYKLIYPYWFGSNNKITYLENKFIVLNNHGNVVRIQNVKNNSKYYVNKTSIKKYN